MAEDVSPAWWWCAGCGSHAVSKGDPENCAVCGTVASMILGRGAPRDVTDRSPAGTPIPPLFDPDYWGGRGADAADVTRLNEAYDRIDHYVRVMARFERRAHYRSDGSVGIGQGARELACAYGLRTVELLEAVADLTRARNAVALFPVMRALYETWFACAYANSKFRKLVLADGNESGWSRVLGDLLLGRSGKREFSYVKPGKMLVEASASFRRYGDFSRGALQRLREKAESDYATLSDGAHPTQYALMAHLGQERPGTPGATWTREPTKDVVLAFTFLGIPIDLLRWELKDLLEAADEADAQLDGEGHP